MQFLGAIFVGHLLACASDEHSQPAAKIRRLEGVHQVSSHSMSLYLSTTPGFQVTSMTSTSTIFCSSTNPFLLKTTQKVPVNSPFPAQRSGTAFRHSGGTPRHRRVPCGEVSGHRKQQAGIQGAMAPQ